MGKCLKEIIYAGKGKRYAFVGLGCHMQALRKAEGLIPALKRRIVVRVGLVCGHCMDWRGTRHLFRLLKVNECDVRKIEFRSDRWPGNFKVTMCDGRTRKIGQIDWTSYVMTLYEKHRCHFCSDPLNQLSDLSTGDPWLNELSHEPGLNLVISRSGIGDEILSKAASDKKIALKETSKEKIVRSQRRSLYRKKYMIRAYMKITKLAGHTVPEYMGQFDNRSVTWPEYREAIILSVFRKMSELSVMDRPLTVCGQMFMAYMRKRRQTTGRMVLK
jgi:coenzyme F420 hydrogenase subunit beta